MKNKKMDELKVFSDIESNYSLIKERINDIINNSKKTNIPSETIKVLIKEVKKNIKILTKKNKKINNILLKKKIEYMINYFENILISFSGFKENGTFYNIQNKYNSIEDFEKEQKLIKKIKILINDYKKENGKYIKISLDDKVENIIENNNDFLNKEYNYLVDCVEILNKVNKIFDFLSNNDIKNLNKKKTFNFNLNKKEYNIKNINIKKTDFYKEIYNLFEYRKNWKKEYNSIEDNLIYINKYFDSNKINKFPFVKNFIENINHILKNNDNIFKLNKNINKLIKNFQLPFIVEQINNYQKDTPYDKIKEEVIKDIYNKNLKKLLQSYNYSYINLKRIKNDNKKLILKEKGKKDNFSKDLNDDIKNINKSIDKYLKEQQKRNESLQNIKLKKYNNILLKEKKVINIITLYDDILKKVEQIINIYNGNISLYKKCKTINNINNNEIRNKINIYMETEIKDMVELEKLNLDINYFYNLLSPKSYEETFKKYDSYLNKIIKDINKDNKKLEQIKGNIGNILSSWNNIKSYKYHNYDSLSQEKNKNILEIIGPSILILKSIYGILEEEIEDKYYYEKTQFEEEQRKIKKRMISSTQIGGFGSGGSWSSGSSSFSSPRISSGGTSW